MSYNEWESTTTPNSRVLLKAKRRGGGPNPELSSLADYAVSSGINLTVIDGLPLPLSPTSTSSPTVPGTSKLFDVKKETETQFQFAVGKTVRETARLQLQQFNPPSVWKQLHKHLPVALDHLSLNVRNLSNRKEYNLYSKVGLIATEFHDQFYSYDPKTSISVLGFPKAVWNKIFKYVQVQDLMSFRSTCSDAKLLVECSLPWAVDVCFVHDERVHLRQTLYPKIPFEMTCTDDSLGWPEVRLRHFKSPFLGKKYFTMENQKQFFKITVLEIHDSALHWTDLLEAISCLPELRDLSYTHTKEYLYQNNVLKIMKGELNDHSEITKAINKNQTKFRKLRRSKSTSSKSLHTVKLQGLNLEITNFVLALLDHFCRHLNELDLIFWEGLFLHASTASQTHRAAPSSSTLVDAIFPSLDAWKLIHNNQETLTALRISFLDEQQHRRMGPGSLPSPINIVQIPLTPILIPAFWPKHENLKLSELILEFPPTVGVQGPRMKFRNKTKEDVFICDAQFLTFCSHQMLETSYFNLKTLHDDSCRIESYLLCALPPNPTPTLYSKDNIVIGKSMACQNESMQWHRMLGEYKEVVTYEFNMYLDNASIPYENIFEPDMPVMTNCILLQIMVKKSIPLRDFNTNRLLMKFPNLKRLALVNSYFRGTPTHRNEISPMITDFDMQAIIHFLPNLTELVLQCNMSEVTDFGLTGITTAASERMHKQSQYTVLPGDKLGYPISKMKNLQVLELHGLGYKVTGVTAYLAFEKSVIEELYLFSPKFTKRQKKDLKDKFAWKKNFKMMIL